MNNNCIQCDYFSKWIKVKRCRKDSSIIIKVIKKVFCRYGIPSIVSDDDGDTLIQSRTLGTEKNNNIASKC